MKYTPGQFVGQLSGKSGSTVASRNRFGSYLRTKVNPVQPNTPFQTLARNRLALLAGNYRLLTESQRTAWAFLGKQIQRYDSLGNAYDLTGLQAYVEVNANRLRCGALPTAVAPALDSPPEIESVFINAEVTPYTLTVAFTPNPLPANTRVLVYASPPVSQAVNFFGTAQPLARRGKGMYKLVLVSNAAATSPIDIGIAWAGRFGSFSAGQKISVMLLPISANFFSGVAVRGDAIAIA